MQYIPYSPAPLRLLLRQYQRHTHPDLPHIFRLLIQVHCLLKKSAPLQDSERQVYFSSATTSRLTLQRSKMIFFVNSKGDCMYGWRTLLHGGNVSRVLKGEMPRIARAEDKSESKQGWELIYKKRNYSKWETSPKTVARTPGTPLPIHYLTHFSLLHVPPPQMRPSRSHTPSKTSPR